MKVVVLLEQAVQELGHSQLRRNGVLQNYVIDAVEKNCRIPNAFVSSRMAEKLLNEILVEAAWDQVVHLHVAQVVIIAVQKNLCKIEMTILNCMLESETNLVENWFVPDIKGSFLVHLGDNDALAEIGMSAQK